MSGRYQDGCLYQEKRKHGSVWVFRYREGIRNRKQIIGSVERYTHKQAKQMCEPILTKINVGTFCPLTVGELVDHYTSTRLTRNKSFSTQKAYSSYMTNWIMPTWGKCALSKVTSVGVEDWLYSLELTDGSKAKIRAMLSILFRHGQRYDLYDRNPIAKVKQGSERQNDPPVLTSDEISRTLAELEDPYRIMAYVAAVTALRVSELLGLKWSDIDFAAGLIRPRRGIVCQHVGPVKTKASKKPIEMTEDLAGPLLRWRETCAYNQADDYVFASVDMQGKQPLWGSSAMSKHIRPAAIRAGVEKHVRWHLFRHWVGSEMVANGENVKTIQDSLRHANSAISLDIYSQGQRAAKQAAQKRLIQSIVPICSQKLEEVHAGA